MFNRAYSIAYSGCTLQVDYVTIPTATGTRTVQAESSGTIFDRGAETGAPGASAFDGVNVINGAELMSENGSLRFVVGLNALAAGYDANGNMTLRLKDGARYFLAYDAENRLTSVSGTASASFAYNGDGQRVSATIDTTITTYIGGYFEWQGGAGTSYYFAGAQRIAMRTGTDLKYLLGDHLGSTAVTATSGGGLYGELRYYPWGGTRYDTGTTPTSYRYTGQREAEVGLYYYGTRYYDPSLGRFVSPDTIIPQQQGSQAWDRYAGMNNNPLRYTDPSGHSVACGIGKEDCETRVHISSDTITYAHINDDHDPPIITYSEEHGLCINGLGCSGGTSYRNWWQNWYFPRLPNFTHLHLVEISTFTQDVAFGVSSAGAGMEAGGLIYGFGGNALHQASTNHIENIASWASTFATLIDDAIFTPDSGSYINKTGVLVISEASATSLVASIVGGIMPIATFDAVIDGYVSKYNHGEAPGIYDLFRIRGVILFGVIQLGE
jgi:RHS repeat-associated protein